MEQFELCYWFGLFWMTSHHFSCLPNMSIIFKTKTIYIYNIIYIYIFILTYNLYIMIFLFVQFYAILAVWLYNFPMSWTWSLYPHLHLFAMNCWPRWRIKHDWTIKNIKRRSAGRRIFLFKDNTDDESFTISSSPHNFCEYMFKI